MKIDVWEIREELANAGHGNKEGVYQRYSRIYGCSKATIQRAIRNEMGRQKTVKREKRVKSEIIDLIAELKMQGLMLSKGAGVQRELSTETCIQMLRDQGVPKADLPTVSTANRRLVEMGFRVRQSRARVEMEKANQELQMDFSRSKYFQVVKWDSDKGDYLLKVSAKELHYKTDDKKLRLWIAQAKESYSRVRDIRGYAAAGESVYIGLDLLHRILSRPDDDDLVLRHAPDTVKTDNGAFAKRKETKTALAAIGCEPRLSTPGNSASQGKVESGFRSLWWTFELPLAVKLGDGATLWLDDYNGLLHEFCVREQEQPHPWLLNVTRREAYLMSIQRHPQTYVEADILEHAFRVETRLVGSDLLFSWQGKKYRAPQYANGKRIRVYQNLHGDVLGEVMDSYQKPFTAIPPTEGTKYPAYMSDDFEHRPKNTYKQNIETRLKQEKRDEKRQPRAEKAGSNTVYFPASENKRHPQSPFQEVQDRPEFESVQQAKIHIGSELHGFAGHGYRDFKEIFDPVLEETLNKEVIQNKIDNLKRAIDRVNAFNNR